MEQCILSVQLDKNLKYEMKRRAASQHISLKQWLLRAIAYQMAQEDNKKKDENGKEV